MKIRSVIILCIAIGVVFLLVGRFTAPKPGKDYRHEYDSIRKERKDATRQLQLARDSVKHFVILSDTWFNLAQKAEKEKLKNQDQYVKDLRTIRNFTDVELDSAIRARFLH